MHAGSQTPLDVDGSIVDLAVEVFSMLADPTRVRIILALEAGELSVNHLADIVDKAPATVSQHLAKMRWSRIVLSRQDGTRVFYRLANEHVRGLVVDAIYQAEHSRGDVPPHHRQQPGAAQGGIDAAESRVRISQSKETVH